MHKPLGAACRSMRAMFGLRREFTHLTSLPPDQVKSALLPHVHDAHLFSLDLNYRHGTDKEFRGRVDQSGFRLIRRIVVRKSFVPVLTGKISAIDGGSKVRVALSLPAIVLGVTLGWVGCAGAAVIYFLFHSALQLSPSAVLFLFPLPFVLPLIGFFVFRAEARHALDFLRLSLPPWVGAGANEAQPSHTASPKESPESSS